MRENDDMIHLRQTTTAQSVTIPRPQAIPSLGAWALKLSNGITRKVYNFAPAPVVNGMVLEVTITFAEKPDKGQYNYLLTRGDVVVSFGLAQVGQADMKPTRVEYKETIETIQYNG